MPRGRRIKRKLRVILCARSLLPHHAKTGDQRFNLDQQLDVKTDRRTVLRIFYADARTSSYIFQTDAWSVLHVSNFNLNLRLGLISAAPPIGAKQRQRQAKPLHAAWTAT